MSTANQVSEYIVSHIPADPYVGTELEGLVCLHNTHKGAVGEFLAKRLLMEVNPNADITPRLSSAHDFCLGLDKLRKVEVKASFTAPGESKIFNHVSMSKDWDILVLVSVGADGCYETGWCNKEAVAADTACSNPYFKHQQGGKSGNNDDFMAIVDSAASIPFIRPLSDLYV